MSFDPKPLRDAIRAHGRVARIAVAETSGSAPREAGTSMLVWADGQSGTIGGGQLELDATEAARTALANGETLLRRLPLGPALGQCCGGAVTLVTEVFDATRLQALLGQQESGLVARPIQPGTPLPLAAKRLLAEARNAAAPATTHLTNGWLIEPLHRPAHPLWIYGAGHVGRAITATMAPLASWDITWIDTAADRFPDPLPERVTQLVAANPAQAVRHAPPDAHHLILTYSHAMDLELCHALLDHGFASAGLIGSASKWTRFRKRLRALGHADASILRIACPIGDPTLGKEPQAIAVGVTAALLTKTKARPEAAMDRPA